MVKNHDIALPDLAGVEYKYHVTVHDGVETMSYHEHGTVSEHFADGQS